MITRTAAQSILFSVLRDSDLTSKYDRIIQDFAEKAEPQDDGSFCIDSEELKEAFLEVFFDDLLNDFVADAESDIQERISEMNENENENFSHLSSRE